MDQLYCSHHHDTGARFSIITINKIEYSIHKVTIRFARLNKTYHLKSIHDQSYLVERLIIVRWLLLEGTINNNWMYIQMKYII